jgi:hypothetical protein
VGRISSTTTRAQAAKKTMVQARMNVREREQLIEMRKTKRAEH